MLRKLKGVTMVELMIVIVLIAIISSVAYPSYTAQVLKANRMDAKRILMQIQSAYERYYVENGNVYNTVSITATYTALSLGTPPSSSFFNYTCTSGCTPSAYTLQAIATANQTSDACTSFQLTNTGARAASSSPCW